MSDKALADVICRALLAIVAAIRKKYGLPAYNNIAIILKEDNSNLSVIAKAE
jgi:hypothetical protein